MATDAELDEVYQRINSAFCRGSFLSVDRELQSLDVGGLDVDIMLAYLITSSWAKEHLPYRMHFVRKCKVELQCRGEDVGALMENLM